MPLPVDDAVSGVWRDSLIYLVSGWHDSDNVAAVQIYDPERNAWEQATPIPGPPVFGYAGGIAGDGIGYDGRTAEPWAGAFAFGVATESWIAAEAPGTSTMDHRGIALAGDRAFIVGGMTAGQRVTEGLAELPVPGWSAPVPGAGRAARGVRSWRRARSSAWSPACGAGREPSHRPRSLRAPPAAPA